KRAEEALRESRAKLEAAFASMAEAIFIADAEGRLIDFNEGFVRYHRFKDREECSRTIADCPRYLEAYFQDETPAPMEMWAMPRALRGEMASDVEYMLRRKDTDETWWGSYNFSPIKDEDGRIIGAVVAGREITDRKRAEAALKEAKESLEQKVRERTLHLQILTEQLEKSRHELRKLASELVISEERERKRVAGVLHDEVAQTLAAARMRLDLLQSIPSDQKDKKTLQEVKDFLVQSIREVRALMNDLGNPLLFDLGLKSACEALGNRLMEGHPIRISCDIQDEYKHLDPDMKAMLFQVVRELLNNVVKHSRAQNAHVRIDAENGQFRVKVTDDGIGFDSKMLGVPSGEGGFGLYSIRERLTAMDGSLSIVSAPGTGTVVTAVL
ncbi:MAG TPA: ATP-binding protein, partial [Syntrophales bacterium]|nr:ATP-binding protein [Syntrophales bacterium]